MTTQDPTFANEPPEPPPKSKREQVLIACKKCRSRKTKVRDILTPNRHVKFASTLLTSVFSVAVKDHVVDNVSCDISLVNGKPRMMKESELRSADFGTWSSAVQANMNF